MSRSKRLPALALCAALLLNAATAVRAEPGHADGGGGPVKYVALTFDDGPTCGLTEQLLDGLRARYLSVTFFLCGYRIAQCPDTVRRMAAEGHELAIHGQTHTYLHNQPQSVVRRELEETGGLIETLTGTSPRLFRPPGGLTSEALLAESVRQGLPLILWSVDPEDWNTSDSGRVVRRIVGHVRDGDIILMHDLSASSIAAALQVVDRLEEEGYQFCTVSELAALRGQPLTPGCSYRRFPVRSS